VALSFQLDKRRCGPAQIAFAGFRSSRTSIVPNSSYCVITLTDTCTGAELPQTKPLFHRATRLPSRTAFKPRANCGAPNRGTIATRWFTLVATAIRGRLALLLRRPNQQLRHRYGGLTASQVPLSLPMRSTAASGAPSSERTRLGRSWLLRSGPSGRLVDSCSSGCRFRVVQCRSA